MGSRRADQAYRQRMRAIPLFADLDDGSIDLLDGVLTEVWVPADTRLTKKGAVGRDFVVILDGLVSIQRDGTEVARLMAHDFLGEHSLLTGDRRNAEVVALTPVHALVAGPTEFARMLELVPLLADRIRAADQERARPEPAE